MATAEERRETDSGIEVKPVYTAEDVDGVDLAPPGEFPFTRGPYADMYRGKPWTLRRTPGSARRRRRTSASATCASAARRGSRSPSTCPHSSGSTPTIRAAGEVGRAGVAIDSLADMELLFDGIRLDEV